MRIPEMAAAFGIHVGNSSACLALHSNGAVSVIANDSGDRVTPAILALNGTEWDIGLPAKIGQARNRSTLTNNKSLLNDDFTDDNINTVTAESSCKVISDEDNIIKYEFSSNETVIYTTPDDIATKIYSKFFTIASNSARTNCDLKTVLAAPLKWSKNSRQRLITAAELAGFDVLQVISEPAAAVLAYGVGETNKEEEHYVLVYRLGGSSCDATVLYVNGGMMSIENSVHRADLGGKLLTHDLVDYIAKEFCQKWKLDPKESRKSMNKLFHHADSCKHILSTLSSAHVFIESLLDGVDCSQNISRARFENAISSKMSMFMEPIHQVLNYNGLEQKINKIILCGGSMKVPKLQAAVTTLLPQAKVLSGISPDEVIAEGCARQAGFLLEIGHNQNLTDIHMDAQFSSKNIHAKYLDKSICIFPENTALYTTNMLTIENTAGLTALDVVLCEDDGTELGSYTIPNPSTPLMIKAVLEQNQISLKVV